MLMVMEFRLAVQSGRVSKHRVGYVNQLLEGTAEVTLGHSVELSYE
jgi:hypothetical protein